MTKAKTRMMVEGAIMVALATVLSFIRVYRLPWGGSITLLSMLPIVVYSIRWGVKNGMLVSFTFALIQLLQGVMDGLFGWGLTPVMLIACILLDYLGAYSVLGVAGLFRTKDKVGDIAGVTLAVALRFVFHFLSGVVIWHSFGELWDGFSTDSEWLYSLLYNGSYMLPELIFTVIGTVVLFSLPRVKKILLSPEQKF